MDKLIETFKKYSKFDALATRSEYWGVILVSWGIAAAAWLSFAIISGSLIYTLGTAGSVLSTAFLMSALAISLLLVWVGIATTVRRCKDAGINPWFTAAVFIPYVGWIAVIVIGVLETKKS